MRTNGNIAVMYIRTTNDEDVFTVFNYTTEESRTVKFPVDLDMSEQNVLDDEEAIYE